MDRRPNPGFCARQIGAVTVTTLNDGVLNASFDLVVETPHEELERLERRSLRSAPPVITINSFLIEDGSSRWLIDAGYGAATGPAYGRIIDALAALGLSPYDIDGVMMTHMHGDHANGLVDPEGRPTFEQADILVSRDEFAFWTDDARIAASPLHARNSVANMRRILGVHERRVRLFEPGRILPNVEAVPLPGHTPGHTGFRIASGDETLLVWGDIVHLPGIQFARPDVAMIFDVDPDQARATRRSLMGQAAAEGLLVAGMHHDFPSFGHVAADGGGFRFIPLQWMP